MSALEMRPEIRARWVTALRSGDYPQTRTRLHDDDGFCCLGVLCDLARRDGIIQAVLNDVEGDWEYAGEAFELPPAVREWAGLRAAGSADPTVSVIVDDERMDMDLASLNDDYDFSFDQIADAIEGAS